MTPSVHGRSATSHGCLLVLAAVVSLAVVATVGRAEPAVADERRAVELLASAESNETDAEADEADAETEDEAEPDVDEPDPVDTEVEPDENDTEAEAGDSDAQPDDADGAGLETPDASPGLETIATWIAVVLLLVLLGLHATLGADRGSR